MRTDEEYAAAVTDAAKALERAMTFASAAGLRVSVDIVPRLDGGFDVWEDIQRPLGRRVVVR